MIEVLAYNLEKISRLQHLSDTCDGGYMCLPAIGQKLIVKLSKSVSVTILLVFCVAFLSSSPSTSTFFRVNIIYIG